MLLTGAVLGTILGYVLQRGRFCVTGFLRDLWLTKSMRGFTALMPVIAVHAIGYWALAATAAFMKIGPLAEFTEAARDRTIGTGTIHGDLGIPVFVPLIALIAVTAWLVYREVSKPKIDIPGLPRARPAWPTCWPKSPGACSPPPSPSA